MDAPETRYAETEDGARIAYQAFGEGERVLVGIPGFAQNVELMWEQPTLARFLRRWGHICRAVVFDKRGTGLSDRRLPQASLEQRVQDLVAVMEAERIERATISGFSEGGALAAFFAATFPERTDGLLICGTPARITRSDDHPWAPTERMMML